MEGLIWDEVPAQRKRRAEQFAFSVVTLSAIAKLGAGRKFSFNAAAQKELDVTSGDRISFGFSTDKKLAAVRKATGDQGFALTQTCTISDKKTYEFMVKMFNLDTAIENHFEISLVNGLHTLSPVLSETTQEVVFEINTIDVGEISDEEDLGADLRGIPTTESLGIEAADEVEEMVVSATIEEDDSTEESVW
tara:strand:+ start:1218 stop:1793 length:576 start_codon:yes stop_codon:yes gene_type:complete